MIGKPYEIIIVIVIVKYIYTEYTELKQWMLTAIRSGCVPRCTYMTI